MVYSGSVLVSLKKSYPEAKFTSLVRSSSHIDLVREVGSDVVLSSHDDHDLVSRLSAGAEIIVNAADSDDVGLLDALLEGQKKRKAEGNSTGVFVHVSGGSIFSDGSKAGKDDPSSKVWTVSVISYLIAFSLGLKSLLIGFRKRHSAINKD